MTERSRNFAEAMANPIDRSTFADSLDIALGGGCGRCDTERDHLCVGCSRCRCFDHDNCTRPESQTQAPAPACSCFIAHAVTSDDRERISEAIAYARDIGDLQAQPLLLAQLTGPCPART
ncbi:hypothetical protein ACFYXF_34770 [Streptomyces sp. NPDC002680]|uniref:hypothetical protein n=1 Tax=Streptomyces sp. NPDC002680 TaxID=3364659 RepID=UPI0036787C0B